MIDSFNFTENINKFYKPIKEKNNHRYLSWEHCYAYFYQNLDTTNFDKDLAALNLAFYLASWGMYRGSSKLLWFDYKVHLPAIEIICKYSSLLEKEPDNINKNKIIELENALAEYYQGLPPPEEKKVIKNKNPETSDILTTKIMMGTLGCCPAYDRFFQSGLFEIGLTQKFGAKSLSEIFNNLCNKDFSIISLKENKNICYPKMKLIDMAIWNIGYQKNLEREKND